MSIQKRTGRLSVLPETFAELTARKMKHAAKLGRTVTWDEFLLERCC